nr:pilus assembly protein TadG-related protein [Sphingomonas sp. AP4-R1]
MRSDRGSIAVLGALALSSVLAMSGLAVELGTGYAAKIRNQRAADMAALGAAVAYKAGGQDIKVATDAANDIAVANGLPSGVATASQVTVNGQSALKVVITTPVPIALARAVVNSGSYDVTTAAYASLVSNTTPACILALSSNTTSVTASGGASISAPGCSVTSNGTIASDNSSAKITAKQVVGKAIADTAASYNQNAITTTPVAKNIKTQPNAAVDTVKNSTAVQTALCYVNKLTGNNDPDYQGGNKNCTSPLVVPTVYSNTSSTDWSSDWGGKSSSGFNQYTNGSCNYTIPAGTYTIRDLTIGGGCSIKFLSGSTLTFRNVNMSGATMTFGDGDITITGTFTVSANDPITMGNGNHSFGQISIGGGKSLTMGTGNFNLVGALTLSGGAHLRVNTAATNTVIIGNDGSSSNPKAISVDGGSDACFTSDCSAPTAAAGTFSASGYISTAGGTTIVFPKSAMHVVKGNLALQGSAIMGDGLYVVGGDWTNGTGGAMTGVNVTFALGGSFNFAGGTSFDLAAPTASSGYGITDMLILTKTSSATGISAGSNGKASGLIYAPNSAFSSSGGSSISGNGSACMMLVVNSVSVTGSGTVNTANCSSLSNGSGSGSATVSLIQ